jgi:hypothetical protein
LPRAEGQRFAKRTGVIAGLDPAIHLLKSMDARVICAKTRFALYSGFEPGHAS